MGVLLALSSSLLSSDSVCRVSNGCRELFREEASEIVSVISVTGRHNLVIALGVAYSDEAGKVVFETSARKSNAAVRCLQSNVLVRVSYAGFLEVLHGRGKRTTAQRSLSLVAKGEPPQSQKCTYFRPVVIGDC